MKGFLLSTIMCSGLALGGCVTTDQVNTEVTDIQQAAVAACGFLPSVATVAAIVGVWTNTTPAIDLANAIATSICQSVTAQGVRRSAAVSTPVYVAPSGQVIAIQGKFVR